MTRLNDSLLDSLPPISAENLSTSTELFAASINRMLRVDVVGQTVIITPNGDSAEYRYRDFHLDVGRVTDLLNHPECRAALIDLSTATSMGPVVMTALGGFLRTVRGQSGFCNVSPEQQEELLANGLGARWTRYPSRAEALEQLNEAN